MANKPDLADYIEVPERIRSFMEKYPDGSLQGEHQLVEVGGVLFVQYIARAYRTPNDERPGVGTTWEPFPGTTPYTRNSEVENAETSAWGRALAALGFIGKKIATQEEIERRRGEDGQPPRVLQGEATDKQKMAIRRAIKQYSLDENATRIVFKGAGVPVASDELINDAINTLSKQQASTLIDFMKEGALPSGEAEIPNDAPKHEPAGEGDQVPFFSEQDAAA